MSDNPRKLDDISFMLGEMSKDIQHIKASTRETSETVDAVEKHLAKINGNCIAHDTRIKKIEKKTVLGGTTRGEKFLIAIGSIGIALKFAWDAFFPG